MASGCDEEVAETATEVFSGRLLDVVNALLPYLTGSHFGGRRTVYSGH
jgi:hypothetical protein